MMRKFGKTLGLTLALTSLACATQAIADTSCALSITTLEIDATGNVNAVFANNGTAYWWFLCNLQGSVTVNDNYGASTIASSTCGALYSQLLTARASGQTVTFYFHGPTACSYAGGLSAYGSWISPYPSNIGF